jgi:hypothetical protein
MLLRAFAGLTVKFIRLMNGVGPALCPVTMIDAAVPGLSFIPEWREKAAKRAKMPINIDVLIAYRRLSTKGRFVNHNLDNRRNSVGTDTARLAVGQIF